MIPLLIHNELPSTQDAALAAARAGEMGPLAILALRQTAGRGRAGRPWHAPAGNLNLSILLRPDPVPLVPAAWALLAGVALFDTAAVYVPSHRLALKWPNDLLLDNAKLAGILIDSTLTPTGLLDWMVIGIGVNLVHAPQLPDRPTACLASTAEPPAPEPFARQLLAHLETWQAAPFPTLREAWLARAHAIGTRLRVHRGNEVIEGAFLGLTDDGRLRLAGATNTASGEVEILEP
jgi:BirA family transcriptional regulator, biotin operon repressor / biotin---[acetyl-CoA-carboxylase] ligase